MSLLKWCRRRRARRLRDDAVRRAVRLAVVALRRAEQNQGKVPVVFAHRARVELERAFGEST